MKLVCYTPEILGYPFNFASAYAEIRARSLAYCCKNIELASELEVPLMLVNPGWGVWDERYDEAFDRAAASLQSAADYVPHSRASASFSSTSRRKAPIF